ncbi:MAG: nitrilase-related carbon-nitrogen hydrolase, partial [Bacillota bacterium]|nr:nitrilase-related carbon-nitrogen hydrolase [Bacillota bacterium]
MDIINQSVKVAVVQAASVIMDRDATIEKAISLIRQASAKGAKIVVFPEAFIPAYPRGLSFGTIIGSRSDDGRRDWYRYWENSIPVPGEATDLLGKAAREAGVYLIIGVIERDREYSGGTLYCSVL